MADANDMKMKHLDMIQAVITRMASNQVQLRTWSVTLGTAIIGYVAAKDGNPRAALLAILPAVTFWIQDGYYLALERKFRDHFDAVRVRPPGQAADQQFDMGTGGLRFWDCLKGCARPAVWLVHLPVLILALGIGLCGWLQR